MLEKRYEPGKVEEGKYDNWVTKGYFTAGDLSKKPFSIVIPPPNVTGKLHLGHVMDTIPDDIICRYKRMKGFDVLWVPGTDHAGIATQAKVDALLNIEGKSRYDIGREAFLEEAWKWKKEYASIIHTQWAKLGLSVDYSRERFTLDEGLNEAVRHVFVALYKEGLVYQGEKIINWDPVMKTALSNIEVIYQDDPGEFYYFAYDVVGSDKKLVIATTRPETMFGDTAVLVNPSDERYKDFVGKQCVNPANGDILPIMADEYVDKSFGTGVMKCTPAHDPNDFALGKKYGFAFIKVLDEEAKMNEKAGKYKGMDRYECRKTLVEDIRKSGHLVKIEKMMHNVGHSERSGAVVEPMLSKQWFVKMKPLASRILQEQKGKNKVNFIPKRFEKVLTRWMENVDDWCISRQLWWGHRIPAYYNKKTGEVIVSETAPKDLENYHQDEDVLDTWFSSGLWPFATLGWPNVDSSDYQRYFPTDVLVTGYDIIFFWVSRMMFQSFHFTDKAPFKEVVIHGLIRDEQGRKMSKSLGNGIDPLDVIAKYGVDALRYFISTNSTPGLDMRYSDSKVVAASNYLNKIWNSCRYVEMVTGENFEPKEICKKELSVLDASILDRLERTIKQVTAKMEKYQFGQASTILYNFVYDDFCSSYLEMSKVALQNGGEEAEVTKNVLFKVMKEIILMISPYAPFVSEEMYLSLPKHLESICLETYPLYDRSLLNKKASEKVAVLDGMIRDIRNYKSSNGIAPNKAVRLVISPSEPFKGAGALLKRFSFASNITISSTPLEGNPFFYDGYTLLVEEDIDKEALKAKLLVEKERLSSEISRGEKMLSNPGFMKKAPAEKVKAEEDKLAKNRSLFDNVVQKLQTL